MIFCVSDGKSFRRRQARFIYSRKTRTDARIIEGEDTLFPKSLTAVEIKRLTQMDMWEPGKRVLTEIHRTGRLNNLSLIITAADRRKR